jgi:hypothetical protein
MQVPLDGEAPPRLESVSMITRSITFWDDVNDGLVERSEQLRISINWLVNQLLKEALERVKSDFELTS